MPKLTPFGIIFDIEPQTYPLALVVSDLNYELQAGGSFLPEFGRFDQISFGGKFCQL
jgi:hypothetical protein